jgi:hypothetical protein
MAILEKLAINRKITAFFADGSQKMNLSIATVVGLLNGTDKVPVDAAPVQRASRLLTDLPARLTLWIEALTLRLGRRLPIITLFPNDRAEIRQ